MLHTMNISHTTQREVLHKNCATVRANYAFPIEIKLHHKDRTKKRGEGHYVFLYDENMAEELWNFFSRMKPFPHFPRQIFPC